MTPPLAPPLPSPNASCVPPGSLGASCRKEWQRGAGTYGRGPRGQQDEGRGICSWDRKCMSCPLLSPHPPLPNCPTNTDHLNYMTHQEGETTTPFCGAKQVFLLSGVAGCHHLRETLHRVMLPQGKKAETHLKPTRHLKAKPSPATSPCGGCHIAPSYLPSPSSQAWPCTTRGGHILGQTKLHI